VLPLFVYQLIAYLCSTTKSSVDFNAKVQGRKAILALERTGDMQGSASELQRITLPRTPVNKGKEKGRESSFGPGPRTRGPISLSTTSF